MLKAWCELRTGRTLGPSGVAEERRHPCRAQWGHDLSMGMTLEEPGPGGSIHRRAWNRGSPNFACTEFYEVRELPLCFETHTALGAHNFS